MSYEENLLYQLIIVLFFQLKVNAAAILVEMAELVMIITTPTPVLVWRGSQESIAKVSTKERFCLIRVRRLHSSFIRTVSIARIKHEQP